MKKALNRLLFILLYIISFDIYGETSVLNKDKSLTLYEGMEIASDQSDSITFEYAYAHPDIFAQIVPDSFYSPQSYWIKFTIKNTGSTQVRILRINNQHTHKIQLFLPQDNYKMKEGGYSMPFKYRDLPFIDFAFVLVLDSVQTKTYYLKIKNLWPHKYNFSLLEVNDYLKYSTKEESFLAFFYGAMVLIAIINLFFFITTREIIYLLYVIFTVSTAFFCTSWDGMGFKYLWPDHPSINSTLRDRGELIMMLSVLLFSLKFLERGSFFTKIKVTLEAIICVRVIFYFSKLTFPGVTDAASALVDGLIFLIITICGIYSYSKGFKQSRYFILSFFFLFIGFVIYFSYLTNLIFFPINFFTLYNIHFTRLGEIIFLSLALADNFNIVKKNNETSQKKYIEQLQKTTELQETINLQLELKVIERTASLIKANEKLFVQSAEIQRINQLLENDNQKLKLDLKKINEARVENKVMSYEDFTFTFLNEDTCYSHLAGLKWLNGFVCRKCSNQKYHNGKTPYSRRCSKCLTDESVIAYTIFNRLKFPITKAYYITYLIYSESKFSAKKLSDQLQLREMTCLNFKNKTQSLLAEYKSSGNGRGGWEGFLLMAPSTDRLDK